MLRTITVRRMIATAAATATALALMTAAAAVPARAGDNDLAKALVAIGAIALIAKVAKDSKRKGHSASATRGVLPAACAIEFQSGREWHRVYSRPCLDRYGFWNLPAQCESAVRVQGQVIPVFADGCLARNGYVPE